MTITRMLAAFVMLLSLLSLTSCLDAEPAEISVIAKQGGKPQDCRVQVFKDGKQLQEVATERGQVYIKQLTPGLYELRFVDRQMTSYPAIRRVNVNAGASEIVNVDLDDTSQNPPAE